jgi:hypothetical protein
MNYDIITEEDYRKALQRFLELCEAEKTEDDVKEMFLLMEIMEKYERDNCCCN